MATSVGGSRYCFSVQWLDPHAKITRTFNLMLWEADLTVEVSVCVCLSLFSSLCVCVCDLVLCVCV